MCALVDTSVFHRVLRRNRDSHFYPIQDAFFGRSRNRQILIYGGVVFDREIRKDKEAASRLRELDSAGNARRIPTADIEKQIEDIKKAKTCKSNDPHIIALARLSGARVLCSYDGNLIADFTNAALLSPKGRVFKKPSHRHVLSKQCKGRCGGPNQCKQ